MRKDYIMINARGKMEIDPYAKIRAHYDNMAIIIRKMTARLCDTQKPNY